MSVWTIRVLTALLLASPLTAAEPMEDLLRRVPDGANAILAIDVQRMYTSPIAVNKNWKKTQEKDYVSVAAGIPPHTRRIVVGAMLEPSTFEPSWRMGVAEFVDPITLTKLTQAVPGSEDTVEGLPVVLSTGNGYLVGLGPKLVGKMGPPNRQALGRWLRSTKKPGESKLSPYLAKAVEPVGTKVDAVLAFDLGDMLDEKGLTARLKDMKEIERKHIDVPELVKELAGIEGVTFALVFDQQINARLQLDFRAAPTIAGPLAKLLISEALDALGIPMLDVQNWSSQVRGNSIILNGEMGERDLRKLGGVLLPSSPRIRSEGMAAVGGSPGAASPGDTAELTRNYFRSVNILVDDMKAEKATTFNKLARLFQQYSKKIDDLPILNVDPEVVNYGAQTASTFRALASSARGTERTQNIYSANQREVTVDTGGSYRYGYGGNASGSAGWSYYRPNYQNVNNYQETNIMRLAAGSNEAAVREQIFQQIDDMTSGLRRKMTDKYKLEF